MSRPKIQYYHIRFFRERFEWFKSHGKQFTLVETSYSKRLKNASRTEIFNHDGVQDDRLLSIINKVRRDGENYIKQNKINNDIPIDWFNLLGKPIEGVMSKVDIKQAYWKYGLLNNIISEETDKALHTAFIDSTYKDLKDARTKVFGALATKKHIRHYNIYGEHMSELETWEIAPTRDLYIEVCRGIDQLMKQCAIEVPECIYYYWDCMFVPKEFEPRVVEFFKSKQYDVSVSETSIEYVQIGDYGYLLSLSDGNIYMTRKENKHLIVPND